MSTSTDLVSSIGNSWIICRSKSYAGRIYYFNTLTGERAWNLSEIEVEKAKKRTSMLQSQNSLQIDNIPEPMVSPQPHSYVEPSKSLPSECFNNNKQIQSEMPSKVYNKQIINNRYPKSPYPYVGQFPQYNPLNAYQFNIPVNPAFSPSLWNVNPQPIFYTPPLNQVSPVVNRVFNNDVPVRNTSMSLSSRFQRLHDDSQSKIIHKKFNSGNEYDPRKRNLRNNFHSPERNMDLRLLILSKKEQQSKEGLQDVNSRLLGEQSSSIMEAPDKSKTLCDEYYDLWSEVKSEPLDITPLKKLLRIKDFEVWYIVIDSNVVLNNVNFLHILLNSDSQCHLMVPEIVMEKIQNATNSRLRTQAHKAAYFISQLVDASVAVIDKGRAYEKSNLKDEIINCCSNLTNQGYHVVLLTDDIELHTIEVSTSLTIFTVRELKMILNNKDSSHTLSNYQINSDPEKETPIDACSNDNRNIKITIPNKASDINFDNTQEQESSESVPTQLYTDPDSLREDILFEETDKSKPLLVEEFVDLNKINKTNDDLSDQGTSTELNTHEPRQSKRIPLKRTLSNDMNTKNRSCEKKRHIWNKNKDKTNFSMVLRNKRDDCDNINNNEEIVSNCDQSENTVTASNESLNKISNDNEINTFGNDAKDDCNETIIKESTSKSLKTLNNDKQIICNEQCEENKNVMFEITSKSMEECLKVKCDEWISRFVQIMEEVMTQILQQDPPFVLDTMLPPWTIYEAAECVKRKFCHDFDVVDASTKLLNVLFEIGGLRAKFKINISPNKYMEMYSYGVYLIDALQSLLNNSEDLQTAAKSLSKLLLDIQDSNSNNNNQDSIIDVSLENVVDEIEEKTFAETAENSPVIDKPNDSQTQIINPQTSTPTSKSSLNTLKRYNLRSQTQNLLQEKELSSKVKFVRNIDLQSSFFTNLRLKKNLGNIKFIENQSESIPNDNAEDDKDVENTNTCDNAVAETKTNENEQTKTDEPKVIRKFVTFPEFEERLKNNSIKDLEDSSSHRSEMEYDEQFDYELMHEGYYCGDQYNYYDDDEIFDENYTDFESRDTVDGNNVNFKLLVEKIEHNIKEAFSSVRDFCEKSYATLRLGGDTEKNKIHQLAEKTQLYVNRLCDALNSVLLRESSDSKNKMRQVFNIDEFQHIIVDDSDLEDYTSFITKSLEQGNILKESVKLILDAINEIS